VGVRVPPDLLDAVDRFIQERRAYGEEVTRAQALRLLAAEALQKMGLLPVR